MKPKRPTTPVIPAEVLAAQVINLGGHFHALGDKAAKQADVARSNRNRRAQRRWETANKAARAVGTAAEATMWLTAIVSKGISARGATSDLAILSCQPVLADGMEFLDALAFEAGIVGATPPLNVPQIRKSLRIKPSPKNKPPEVA